MEAKLGVRYHERRRDIPFDPRRRDPMMDDVFDVEADFTWANDSAFDFLQLRFPGDANGNAILPANPNISGGKIPPNADVRHHYRDVFGVRVGGDFNVVPDRLALRAGAFVETRAADPTYVDIDFDPAERIGFSLGGTYRIPLGEPGGRALDVMLGYGHVFFATIDHSDPNAAGLTGTVGSACNPPSSVAGATCPSGNQKYRTNWPINLGTLTDAINVVNVGASYRF
jgi:long-chain fatty acid transport protein